MPSFFYALDDFLNFFVFLFHFRFDTIIQRVNILTKIKKIKNKIKLLFAMECKLPGREL